MLTLTTRACILAAALVGRTSDASACCLTKADLSGDYRPYLSRADRVFLGRVMKVAQPEPFLYVARYQMLRISKQPSRREPKQFPSSTEVRLFFWDPTHGLCRDPPTVGHEVLVFAARAGHLWTDLERKEEGRFLAVDAEVEKPTAALRLLLGPPLWQSTDKPRNHAW